MIFEEGTREILIKSLIELLEEHPLNEITVKEVAYKAGVSRRTFYNYFSSVREAIKAHANSINNLIIERIMINKKISDNLIAKIVFETWYEYREFYKLLLNDPSIDSMSIFQISVDLRESRFGSRIPRLGINQKGYINSFVVGGLLNLIKQWLNSDDTESAAEIINIYSMIMKGIEGVIETDNT